MPPVRSFGAVQASVAALTPTALRSFETCRHQFELTYLDKRRSEPELTADLILGNAMHEALATIFRLPPADRDLRTAHAALRSAWVKQGGRDVAFLTPESECAVGRSALEQLTRFFEDFPHEVAIKPLAVEQWLRAPLANGAVIGGRVDRIDRGHAPADSLVVTDYKTGACHFETPSDLADDRGAQIYALVASRAAGQPVTEICFHYLREGHQLRWAVELCRYPAIGRRRPSRSCRSLSPSVAGS